MKSARCYLWLLLPLLFAGLGTVPGRAQELTDELMTRLASAELSTSASAGRELERFCFEATRPGADELRRALEGKLSAKVGDEKLPVHARLAIMGGLRIVGNFRATRALGKVLRESGDAALREGARQALEGIPSVLAKGELRKSLATATGTLRIGIMHALGRRGDFLAAGALMGIVADKAEPAEQRVAAVEALSLLGQDTSVPVVEGVLEDFSGVHRNAVWRAYLRLGDSLVANGEKGAGRRVYERALRLGPAERAAALMGFARANLPRESERIMEFTRDADPRVRAAAFEAATIMPGAKMTQLVIAALKSPGDSVDDAVRRSALYVVLARRGDAAALEAVLGGLDGVADVETRAAIVRGLRGAKVEAELLKRLADVLLAAATQGAAPVRAAAVEVLRELPTAALTGELNRLATEQRGAARLLVIGVLGARGDPAAVEPLTKLLESDADVSTRVTILTALGQIGDHLVVKTLIDALKRDGSADEKQAATAALMSLSGEKVEAELLKAAKDVASAAYPALVQVLARHRVAGAVKIFARAVESDEEALRLYGLRGLAAVGGEESQAVLARFLKSGTESERKIVVAGSLRHADAIAGNSPGQAAEIYAEALRVSKSEDHRRRALRGLAEVGDVNSLAKVYPLVVAGSLQRDAGVTALRIAQRLPEEKRAEKTAILRRLLSLDVDDQTATQSVRRLRRLGVNEDAGTLRGAVTRWWVLAPLPNKNGALWDQKLFVETKVDPKAEVSFGGQSFRWEEFRTDHPRGLVLPDATKWRGDSRGAYLYAEFHVESAGDVTIRMGSDDQIVSWLNGTQLHARRVTRGLQPDQDVVKARLRKGKNTVLLKVLNDGGAWGASFRVTDEAGRVVPVRQ